MTPPEHGLPKTLDATRAIASIISMKFSANFEFVALQLVKLVDVAVTEAIELSVQDFREKLPEFMAQPASQAELMALLVPYFALERERCARAVEAASPESARVIRELGATGGVS